GISEKRQQDIIDKFRQGKVQCLGPKHEKSHKLKKIGNHPNRHVLFARVRKTSAVAVASTDEKTTETEQNINGSVQDEKLADAKQEKAPEVSQRNGSAITISSLTAATLLANDANKASKNANQLPNKLTPKQIVLQFCSLKQFKPPEEEVHHNPNDKERMFSCKITLSDLFPLEKKVWITTNAEMQDGLVNLYVQVLWKLYQVLFVIEFYFSVSFCFLHKTVFFPFPLSISFPKENKIERMPKQECNKEIKIETDTDTDTDTDKHSWRRAAHVIPRLHIPTAFQGSFTQSACYCYAITISDYRTNVFGIVTPRPIAPHFLTNIQFDVSDF
ncbi:hypothetical protein RFI_15004, partial [Reticulomyxa filosa]